MKTRKILIELLIVTSVCLFVNVSEAVYMPEKKEKKGISASVQQPPAKFGGGYNKEEPKKPEYAPGQIIVKFKPQVSEKLRTSEYKAQALGVTTIDSLHAKYKVKKIEPVFKELYRKDKTGKFKLMTTQEEASLTAQKYPEREKRAPKDAKVPDLENIFILEVEEDTDIVQAIEEYKKDPNVEYAEPNYIMKIQMVPNDPYYHSSGSWGQSYDDLWGIKKIQCEQAWDISQGVGVVVAVIDTGVDYNHEDLQGNIWANEAELNGVTGVDDDGNGYIDDVKGYDFAYGDSDPMDGHGHGTHCSGTIAAVGNNNKGVIGVAPMAKIMVVKGLNNQGSGPTSVLAQCVRYAADNGADVISNSWSAGGTSQTLTDAFHYADSLGAVCVAAAGNSNADVSGFMPANIDTVIAVAATDYQDNKASFSNYGAKIDVAAPGVGVLSLRAAGTDMYGDGSHIVGEKYYWANGTSMACPHVAGLAALVVSADSGLTNMQVRNIIRYCADDIGVPGKDNYFGFGRINCYATLDPPPRLWLTSVVALDIVGDGDGRVERGETIGLIVTLETFKSDFNNVSATLYCTDPIVTIENNHFTFGNISKGALADNSANPYKFIISNDCQGKHTIDFTLNIIADGYSAEESISIPVIPPWPFKTDANRIFSSPAVADINGDGYLEIIIGTDNGNLDGHLYCVDGTGHLLWKYHTGRLDSSPAVADLNGDGNLEILVGEYDFDGYLYCMDKMGNLVWRYRTGHTIFGSPTAVDLNSDGNLEILVSSYAGLYCINKTGNLVWKNENIISYSSPAIADINGDGDLEILLGSDWEGDGDLDGRLYCVDNGGNMVWSHQTGNRILSSPAVTDINNDGNFEILFASWDNYVYCIDEGGNLVWKYETPGCSINSSPAVVDLNGDGYLEILVGSADNCLHCIDKGGSLVWKYQTGGNVDSSPTIADLDGNGYLEILIGSDDDYLYCLDKDGNLVWKYKTGGEVFSSPAIADINGDGDLEVLAGSFDAYVYCVDKDGNDFIPTPIEGAIVPMPWPMFRHDIQHTGFYSTANMPPILDPIGNKTVDEMQFLNFTITAADPDVGDTLTYSATNLPTGANLDAITGEFSWTPTYEQAGNYSVTFEVSDSQLSASEEITITVNNVNRPPVFIPIGNKVIDEGKLLQFTITAQDPDHDPLTLSIDRSNPLPKGIRFTDNRNGTGLFSWKPFFFQVGTHSITFIASDGKAAVSETITIKVNDGTPPQIQLTYPQEGKIYNSVQIRGIVTDNYSKISYVLISINGDTPTESAVNNGAIYYYVLPNSGRLNQGLNSVKVTAQDEAGNTSSKSVTFTYDSISPAVTITSPKLAETVSKDGFEFKGQAEDSGTGIAKVTVTVYDYARKTWTVKDALCNYDSTTKQWSFKILPTHITPGNNAMLSVTCYDNARNATVKAIWVRVRNSNMSRSSKLKRG